MKPSLLFILSAIYLAIGGLGLLLVPHALTMGILPANASVALTGLARGLGATLLAIATLNALVRNHPASKTRDAVFLGNTVGFGLNAINDIMIQLSGTAPSEGWGFVVLDVLFTIGFIWVGKKNMSTA